MFAQGFGTQGASGNVKIKSARKDGPKVFATYRPVGATCPADCGLLRTHEKDGGCYAQGGNVNMHQRTSGHMTTNFVAWARTLTASALIRWNVSGDVVGTDGPVYRESIRRAHVARPDLGGWLYTHAWRDSAVQAWAASLPSNVACVASCDSWGDIPAAAAAFKSVATVAAGTEDGHWDAPTAAAARDALRDTARDAGLRVVICPAQRRDANIGCADCRMCDKPGKLIVFAAHGGSRNKARRSLGLKVVTD